MTNAIIILARLLRHPSMNVQAMNTDTVMSMTNEIIRRKNVIHEHVRIIIEIIRPKDVQHDLKMNNVTNRHARAITALTDGQIADRCRVKDVMLQKTRERRIAKQAMRRTQSRTSTNPNRIPS
jgi:hypothetical protein